MTAEGLSAGAAWLALPLGIGSLFVAWKALRLSQANEKLLRSDEEIVAGRLQKPELAELAHRSSVLWTQLVNRSIRGAEVSNVHAFQSNGSVIEITWAGRIDAYGNPQDASGILAIEKNTAIFLRRNDGEPFREGTTVKFMHSFEGSPLVLKYQGAFGWDEWATS